MITQLHDLQNTHRPYKRRKCVGRGVGSGRGKTSCRGHKGAGARSGWKSRPLHEGGQLPLFKRIATRGFSNAQFKKEYATVNLNLIEELFSDGELVSFETLCEKRIISHNSRELKVLGEGSITKKVSIEATRFSKSAIEKLEANKVQYKII